MATRTKTAEAVPSDQATGERKGRKNLFVILALLLLAAVAGWYLLLGPGAGKGEDADGPPEPGEVVALEPITMNLADGRLLKIGLALQLPLAKEGEKEELTGSLALDETISFLGRYGYADLVSSDAREAAKAELSVRVSERYHGEVMQVYFTEFVMQ